MKSAKKNIEINTLYVGLQSLQKQKAQLVSETKNASKEFAQNNTKLPKNLDHSRPDVIEAVCQKKEKELTALHDDIASMRSLKEKITKYQTIYSSHRQALAQAEGKAGAAMEKISAGHVQLDRLKNEEAALKDKRKIILSELILLLAPHQLEFNEARAQHIESELSARFIAYTTSSEKLQKYQIDHVRIKTDLDKTCEAFSEKEALFNLQQSDCDKEKTQLENLEAARNSLFGNKDPQHERERLNNDLKEKRMQVEKAHAELGLKITQLNSSESRILQLREDTDARLGKTTLLTRQLQVQLSEKKYSRHRGIDKYVFARATGQRDRCA